MVDLRHRRHCDCRLSLSRGLCTSRPVCEQYQHNLCYVGFSVGAGVEYAFTQHLLGRLQYIYDDFGSKNYAAVDGGTYRVRLTSQTLRGALSWKF
jgi:opacity protein-like surface antigen